MWAFGVVLFEMLTGRQLFDGESVSDVIAAVLKDEPDWNALPPATPPAIRRLLRRCLERDRKKRWPDAAAARMECEDALTGGHTAPAGARLRCDGAFAVAPAWRACRRRCDRGSRGVDTMAVLRLRPPPVSRFEIELPDNRVFSRAGRHVLAISPDGSQIAYVANRQIFLRSLDDTAAAPLAGTESDPSEPVFSPGWKMAGVLVGWPDEEVPGQRRHCRDAGNDRQPVWHRLVERRPDPSGRAKHEWAQRSARRRSSPCRPMADAATDLVTLAADESAQRRSWSAAARRCCSHC